MARNLDAVVLALFDSGGPALSDLAMAPARGDPTYREALEGGAPGFTAIQEAVTGHPADEQKLGRAAETVDPHTVALALFGTAHHLLMTSGPGPRPAHRHDAPGGRFLKG